jgi:bacterioferritin-associated ferredoxin
MRSDHIVCQCNMVSVGDVEMYVEAFPEMPLDQLKAAMKIGSRCGCCQLNDCPTIDVKFEQVVKFLKNNK